MQNQPYESTSGIGPGDLRESIGEPKLVELALNAVQTLDWSCPELREQENDEFRPQMMMTLLTYSYSAGLFGSWDVEWATRHEKTARYICAHYFPHPRAIQAFRRKNRRFLHKTLRHLLQQAWAWRLEQNEDDYPGYAWIEAVLSTRIDASARNRLEAAVLMDEILFES